MGPGVRKDSLTRGSSNCESPPSHMTCLKAPKEGVTVLATLSGPDHHEETVVVE